MDEEEIKPQDSWLIEIKWWLSAIMTLMPVLLVAGVISSLGVLALVNVEGVSDRYSIVIGGALRWAAVVPLYLAAFMVSALLGCRLLVPTFAGAPPRGVAVVMATWPLALGAGLVWSQIAGVFLFAAIGVAWALMMPLPRKSLLATDSLRDAAIVGLAFSTLVVWQGPLWAIMWCAWRLYRNKPLEVAVTAACAAIMPILLILSELRNSQGSVTGGFVVEVLILLALVVAGLALWKFPRSERELEDEDEEYDEA
jgi:ABC-type transport system involved in multi-copper enzyme maturation permease subunit